MKKTVADLKTKGNEELKTILLDTQKDLVAQRVAIATKKQKNFRLLKIIRAKKARIKTILRIRELEEKNV